MTFRWQKRSCQKLVILFLAIMVFASISTVPAWAQADTGGIAPVSAAHFIASLQGLGNRLYNSAAPIIDVVAKLAFAAIGIFLIVAIFLGAKALRWILGTALAMALGILIFYGAPWIVEVIKHVAFSLQQ